jgi:hypothetical protein
MKKLNFLIVFGLLIGLLVNTKAQELLPVSVNPSAEASPNFQPSRHNNCGNTKALWDVQFSHLISSSTAPISGAMGICHYKAGNEFWVSKWGSDTLFRFNESGVFLQSLQLAGLTGVRALTTDGTYLYATNNSAIIYRINPVTKTLAPPHITTTITQVRHCSYDPTANSGDGGFWVGNASTDITLINMSGTTTLTILAATHGITGMYGSAVDTFTSGGPYLWLFTQSAPNYCQIFRMNLATGITSGISHDAMGDVGTSLSSGLAGGLFISDGIISGKATLGGIIQGTPTSVMFGYELVNLPITGTNSLFSDASFSIFPNPTADKLFVRFEDANMIEVDMELISMTGQVLRRRLANPAAELMVAFDVESLPAGMYYLRIRSEAGDKTYSVIKK